MAAQLDHAFATFDTVLGPCGIAWGPKGIRRVVLPQADKRALQKELRGYGVPSSKLPPEIKKAIAHIQRTMKGRKVELAHFPVDFGDVTPFHRRIYEATRKVAWGSTASYGDVARAAGSNGAARAVGQAMARNKVSIIIPCHRVLASGNKIGGFNTYGGLTTKEKLLALEGIYPKGSGAKTRALSMGELDVKKALQALGTADPELGKLIRAIGEFGLTQKRPGTPFQRLAEAVIYQQLATKAAAAISKRVKEALEGEWHPEGVLKADEDLLRMAGLSRAKLATIKALAEKAVDGTIPHVRSLQSMSDEEIISRFVQVKGIGEWTAQMYLMFALLRPDVLPATDFGVRKGYQIWFKTREMPSVRELQKRAERWKPYRSIASWYLWRATDSL